MPRFAANLSLLFTELPFLDRFAAAARAGFRGVEIQLPYEAPAEAIAERLARHGLDLALFNTPLGDFAKGDRGLAAQPGREAAFAAALDRTLAYARVLRCPCIHVMAGMLPPGTPRQAAEDAFVGNLRRAAPMAAADGVTLLVEPLNAQDNPGYFLERIDDALAIIDRVGAPNVGLQLDLYHCALTEGDPARRIRELAGRYAHVQIAGAPGRHEPDTGTVDYPPLFDLLDSVGYDGWVGCEYRPAGDTLAGLAWARPWGIGEGEAS